MRIGFVSEWGDLDNPNIRSGVPYYIARAMRLLGHEVVPIIPKKGKRTIVGKIKGKVLALFFNSLLKKTFGFYIPNRSKEYLKAYANQVQKTIKDIPLDLLFCPGTLPVSYLETKLPLVIWVDATFENYINYYPGYKNLNFLSIKDGHVAEKQALDKSALIVYTSKWASDSAVNYYNCNPAKVKIIPRGANLNFFPDENEIKNIIDRRSKNTCNILFIGADWERKGGVIVLETCKLLFELGFDFKLHVVGNSSNKIVGEYPWLIKYGRLKKADPVEYNVFNEVLSKGHILFMPTRSEAFGIIYAEASAFGIYSIASDTGGVSSAIKNGVNGKLFTLDTKPEEYASYISELFKDKSDLRQKSLESYSHFKTEFNWCQNVEELINYCNKIGIEKN